MKFNLTWILGLLLPFCVLAQSNNVFLKRSFWTPETSTETVKNLIEQGNDPTALDKYSFDATVYAILNNAPLETIQYLTSIKGNEVDKITHDGRNYLLWAAYAGNINLVEYLINKGSDIHLVDEHGYDLVTFTAVSSNINTALYEIYKKHGFTLKDSKKNGANVLLIASPNAKDLAELQYFVNNDMPLNSEDNFGNNVYLYAVSKGNMHLLNQLKNQKIDIHKVNNKGENALLLAAKGARRFTNSIEVFEYLMDLGINPVQTNNDNENILHYLAKNNEDWKIYELFINKGVNINQVSEKGETPFLLALKYNNEAVLNQLYKLNEDFNLKTEKGYNALSFAVLNHNFNQIKKLSQQKLDFMVKTDNNESLLNLLFKSYQTSNKDKFDEIFYYLIEKGVEPSVLSNNGNTIYHTIVEKSAEDLLPYANKLNVNINKANKEGLTPLQLAAMTSSDMKMIELLKQYGANTDVKTEFDESITDLMNENELLNPELKQLK